MRKILFSFLITISVLGITAQEVMTPEILLQLGKVSGKGITQDGKNVIYSVSKYSLETNSSTKIVYQIPINGGTPQKITEYISLLKDKKLSSDGKYKIITKDVKLKNVTGQDHYSDVSDSNVKIIDALNYRHWDTWEDGAYSHIMYQTTTDDMTITMDIMPKEPYYCPQKPFG